MEGCSEKGDGLRGDGPWEDDPGRVILRGEMAPWEVTPERDGKRRRWRYPMSLARAFSRFLVSFCFSSIFIFLSLFWSVSGLSFSLYIYCNPTAFLISALVSFSSRFIFTSPSFPWAFPSTTITTTTSTIIIIIRRHRWLLSGFIFSSWARETLLHRETERERERERKGGRWISGRRFLLFDTTSLLPLATLLVFAVTAWVLRYRVGYTHTHTHTHTHTKTD